MDTIKDVPLKITAPFSVDSFYVPANILPYLDGILMPHGMIDSRVEKIAWNIASFYQNEQYIILTILKGAIHFSSILTKYLANIYSLGPYKNSIRNEFVRVKSYLNEKSTGKVTISGIEGISFENKNVLIVEDIIDSGESMKCLLKQLEELKPKSIKICTLIQRKPKYDFPIDFSAIECNGNDYFVVGYGLDYNEFFRDLLHLACLNKCGKETFAKNSNEQI